MNTIKFSHNWNHKLNCDVVPTFRPENGYYQPGHQYELILEGKEPQSYGPHECVGIWAYTINNVLEYLCLLDTGYSKASFEHLIKTMYKNKNFNWDTQKFYWILLKKIK